MAVRRALGLYTSRLAALAEAKRTPEQTDCTANRTIAPDTSANIDSEPGAATPADPLGARRSLRHTHVCVYRNFFRFPLWDFRQFFYRFRADLPDIFPVLPASEAVEKEDLSIFQPIRTNDIFVHNVRHEILI